MNLQSEASTDGLAHRLAVTTRTLCLPYKEIGAMHLTQYLVVKLFLFQCEKQ